MTEMIIDQDTTDEELESLVGRVLSSSAIERFGSFEFPKEILSAYRMSNGWIRIDFTANTYEVFQTGKAVWNA